MVNYYSFLVLTLICYASAAVLFFLNFSMVNKFAALGPQESSKELKTRNSLYGYILFVFGIILNLLTIILRGIEAGYFPLSNLFEMLLFMTLFAALSYFIVIKRDKLGLVVGLTSGVLVSLLVLALFINKPPDNLIPALQSWWRIIHVPTMVASYGAYTISFVAAVLFFVYKNKYAATLDRIAYISVSLGTPLIVLGIILGAIWADQAWGRPWAWDPKETWSAITGMIYLIYLHMRFIGNMKWNMEGGYWGKIGPWILILGFISIQWTAFGVSYFIAGLHSYGGIAPSE